MLQSSGRTRGVTMFRVCGHKGGWTDTDQTVAPKRGMCTLPNLPSPSFRLGSPRAFPRTCSFSVVMFYRLLAAPGTVS